MQDQIFEGSQNEMELQLKLGLNFTSKKLTCKNVTKYSVYNLSVNVKTPKQ